MDVFWTALLLALETHFAEEWDTDLPEIHCTIGEGSIEVQTKIILCERVLIYGPGSIEIVSLKVREK